MNKAIFKFFIFIFIFQAQLSYGCLNGETLVLKNGVLIYHDENGENGIPIGRDFNKHDFEASPPDLSPGRRRRDPCVRAKRRHRKWQGHPIVAR